MLVLSENASSAIRDLVDRPELPDVSGVRIAVAESNQLGITAAGMPAAGDQVVEDHGARVFLEPAAAAMLDDKVLDVTVDDEGRFSFLVSSQ
jgi:iron-sulfur cluster assembly protein